MARSAMIKKANPIPKLEWQPIAFEQAFVKMTSGHIYNFQMTPVPEGWLILAVRGILPRTDIEKAVDKMHHIFDNHEHKVLGPFETKKSAYAAAQKLFGEMFVTEIEKCSCEEIVTGDKGIPDEAVAKMKGRSKKK